MPIRQLSAFWIACTLAAASAVATDSASAVAADSASPSLPPADQQMSWPLDQKPVGFRNMARIYRGDPVKRGSHVFPLPRAPKELSVHYQEDGHTFDAAGFMQHNHVAGLLVLHRGKIVLERYALGQTEHDLWVSYSVAKSIMSTLLGAALRDGAINSLDDPVTRYIPELAHSSYEGVTLRQALTMSVGLRWNEDYKNPSADAQRVRSLDTPGDTKPGTDVIEYMSHLPRVAQPGTQFLYSSGNAQIVGIVVQRATKKTLAAYLSEKIWAPLGMEADGVWIRDRLGRSVGSSVFNATLRDYGRFGYFILHGGKIAGTPVLADGWLADATRSHLKTDWGDVGYGYQWWINADGSFRAIGIFGQEIFLDPKNDIVIVTNSAWPDADWDPGYEAVQHFNDAVVAALTANP